MDIVVPGLNVAKRLPLFCAITIVFPLTRYGKPRGGTSNKGSTLFVQADKRNAKKNYPDVISSGLGALYSLGFETYGRWHSSCIDLLEKLAHERSRGTSDRIRHALYLFFFFNYNWSFTTAT